MQMVPVIPTSWKGPAPRHRVLGAGQVPYVRHSIQSLAQRAQQQPAGCPAHLPVCLVQLHDPLLQLPGLVRGEAELTDIVAHVFLCIVVT